MSEPILLTVPEAAAQLRVHRSYFDKLVARGNIRTLKIGRRRMVRPEALAEFIEKNEAANA